VNLLNLTRAPAGAARGMTTVAVTTGLLLGGVNVTVTPAFAAEDPIEVANEPNLLLEGYRHQRQHRARRAHRASLGRRLPVSLRVGPDLARLGPGARLVALIAAAHAGRVALIWPARAGRRQGQERLKKGLSHSKQRCPPGSTTSTGFEYRRTS
jgi:hypothetical protein